MKYTPRQGLGRAAACGVFWGMDQSIREVKQIGGFPFCFFRSAVIAGGGLHVGVACHPGDGHDIGAGVQEV